MGGACVLCEYNRCADALECHHLDPEQKDFQISKVLKDANAWAKIVPELRKCVLLCANCHREVHAGVAHVHWHLPRFNEEFADYRDQERLKTQTPCPVCDTPKHPQRTTCSKVCFSKWQSKVDWDKVDLLVLVETQTFVSIAADLGVSDAAVRKRYKKLLDAA